MAHEWGADSKTAPTIFSVNNTLGFQFLQNLLVIVGMP